MKKIVMPGGISAIFDPYIFIDPFFSGARGAGLGVSDAVEIKIEIKSSDSLKITNQINGKKIRGGIGEVTVKTFFEYTGIESKYEILIQQDIEIPIGAGFGTSASSALGIVLLLSRILNVPITFLEAGNIAHLAEIRAKSGLGTVSGLVYLGDIVIVSRPGAPIYCTVDRILLEDKDIFVVLASKGKKETAIALSDKDFIVRASMYGKLAVDDLIKNPTVENFFAIAHRFAENIGLMTKTISKTINALSRYCIGAAQAMIGDSIFALVYKENIDTVKQIIEETFKTKPVVKRLVRYL
ncbi:MAG: hypothetical protein Q6363_000305 [Candidatus Njordarchaeota archaeon]